jgi:hypothetical protein
MAYLGLSNFEKNRRFLDGDDDARPETGGPTPLDEGYDLSADYRSPGQARRRLGSPHVPDPFSSRRAPTLGRGSVATPTQSPLSAPPTLTPTTESQPTTQAPTQPAAGTAGPQPAPTLASYTRQGSLGERLFSPITTGAQAGQQSLTQAGDLFRREAGPSRTYEGIGAEGTLRDAYTTGRAEPMEAARGLVGARYEGPGGLDQGTVSGLQRLTDDLRTRQRALGQFGGLETLIGQSVPGLTAGEARFEARRELPGARVQARDLGFQQINPLMQRLADERAGAEAFATQRAGEEADIADRSRGFLTGERGGISAAIENLMAERAAQQAAAQSAYGGIQGAPDAASRLSALEGASPFLRLGTAAAPADLTGAAVAERFNTPGMQQKAEADRLWEEIMGRPEYAGISSYDPLELGVSGRGKAFYDLQGEDVRGVVDDPATRRLLYDRQQELEKSFDPMRGQSRVFSRTPSEGGELANVRPLYHGDAFEAQDPSKYLGFDPGIRPSRQNSSSGVQKEQFNRINDLLGEMDRIAEGGDPFRAASIFADADKYIADEEAALEARGEELTAAGKEWAGSVKKLRKAYRKAKREKEYAKIGSVIGGVVGGVLGVPGGPLGIAGGASTGSSIGGGLGRSVA